MKVSRRDILIKLMKHNKNNYILFITSVIIIVTMVTSFALTLYSPTVNKVLYQGGTTQEAFISMFALMMFGGMIFTIYAHSLYLKFKSKEIGLYISIGVTEKDIVKLLHTETSVINIISSIIGLIISIPFTYFTWWLGLFFAPMEEGLKIRLSDIKYVFIYLVLTHIILLIVNRRYIKTVDVISILKQEDKIEKTVLNKPIFFLIGLVLVLAGLMLFIKTIKFEYVVVLFLGFYLSVSQIGSIGDIALKVNKNYYYKNIIFFSLLRKRANQYKLAIFVTTVLLSIIMYIVMFNAVSEFSRYLTVSNRPYDYAVGTNFNQKDFTKEDIYELAFEYDIEITEFEEFESLLISEYSDKWVPNYVVSESTLEHFTKVDKLDLEYSEAAIINPLFDDTIESYTYTPHPRASEVFEYKVFGDLGYITLHYRGIYSIKEIFNVVTPFFYSVTVISDELYEDIYNSVNENFIVTSYNFNTSNDNKENEKNFANALIIDFISSSNDLRCINLGASSAFDITGEDYKYISISDDMLAAERDWEFMPFAKVTGLQSMSSYSSVYFLLAFFAIIIMFVSSIMVISIKIITIALKDKKVYCDIVYLGEDKENVEKILIKQLRFIYFIPVITSYIGIIIFAKFGLQNTGMATRMSTQPVFLFVLLMATIVLIFEFLIYLIIKKFTVNEITNDIYEK